MRKSSTIIPLLLSITFTLLVFWKLPTKGLVPFPGDLLVGRFFPYNSQSYLDYVPGAVPYKEFISADTIRQTYPWRLIAIEQLKSGQMPWWNPYAFSGTPLLANLQSAPFYPLNLLYWLFNFNTAWIIQVILQPTLAIFFTYLFARSLKLSKTSSLFSGISFAFAGYITTWLELNTVGHAALWLPFVLWTTNKAKDNNKFYLLTSAGFAASIFAGHIQTTLYILIIATVYQYYQCSTTLLLSRQQLKKLSPFLISVVLAFAITSIQLLPAFQLFKLSPRSGASLEQFQNFLVPPRHLVTLLAPNYFGNPATNNFWGQDYNEFMAYFGVTALALVLISILTKNKSGPEKFFITSLFFALFFSVKNPIAYLPFYLKLPILSSSAPSRALFLVQFSGAILAGFGLDKCFKSKNSANKSIVILSLVFASIWAFSFYQQKTTDPTTTTQYITALRNLVIPTGSFIIFSSIVIVSRLIKNKAIVSHIKLAVFIAPLFGYSVFANKYLPFSDPAFIFPSSQPFNQLSSIQDQDRFFGDYTASVTSNIWIPNKLYSTEGYDSLYIERYGQLLASSHLINDGKIPDVVPRSDANLPPNQDDASRQRLQDLLGVKYIFDKNDNPGSDWEQDVGRHPEGRYKLIWQQDRFKILENLSALPRALLIPNHIIDTDSQKIVERLLDPNWDLYHTIILEEEPQPIPGLVEAVPGGEGNIDSVLREGETSTISYSPNQVQIQVSTPKPQYLFLSDAYFPGWQARVGDRGVPLYRANFAFRAVLVPQGSHLVTFYYSPDLFN